MGRPRVKIGFIYLLGLERPIHIVKGTHFRFRLHSTRIALSGCVSLVLSGYNQAHACCLFPLLPRFEPESACEFQRVTRNTPFIFSSAQIHTIH